LQNIGKFDAWMDDGFRPARSILPADLTAPEWARRWEGNYAHEARERHFTVLVA
jgi:hypothetical protein